MIVDAEALLELLTIKLNIIRRDLMRNKSPDNLMQITSKMPCLTTLIYSEMTYQSALVRISQIPEHH